MIGTRIGTRAGTRARGGHPLPAKLPPVDLAAALVAQHAAGPLAAVKLYRDRAGDGAPDTYLIFSINSGAPIRTDSDNYWYDQRVRVTAYAPTSDAANALRDQAWAALSGVPYDFAGGFSIPLFRRNHSEATEAKRKVLNGYLFSATWDASARTREEPQR